MPQPSEWWRALTCQTPSSSSTAAAVMPLTEGQASGISLPRRNHIPLDINQWGKFFSTFLREAGRGKREENSPLGAGTGLGRADLKPVRVRGTGDCPRAVGRSGSLLFLEWALCIPGRWRVAAGLRHVCTRPRGGGGERVGKQFLPASAACPPPHLASMRGSEARAKANISRSKEGRTQSNMG